MKRSLRPHIPMVFIGALAVTAVIGVSVGTHALSNGKGNPGPNPEAGMTDAQRIQFETTAFAQFETRRAAWFATFDFSSVDYAKLDRSGIRAQIVEPLQTFDASVTAAKAIVIGSVKSIAPDAQGQS